ILDESRPRDQDRLVPAIAAAGADRGRAERRQSPTERDRRGQGNQVKAAETGVWLPGDRHWLSPFARGRTCSLEAAGPVFRTDRPAFCLGLVGPSRADSRRESLRALPTPRR